MSYNYLSHIIGFKRSNFGIIERISFVDTFYTLLTNLQRKLRNNLCLLYCYYFHSIVVGIFLSFTLISLIPFSTLFFISY